MIGLRNRQSDGSACDFSQLEGGARRGSALQEDVTRSAGLELQRAEALGSRAGGENIKAVGPQLTVLEAIDDVAGGVRCEGQQGHAAGDQNEHVPTAEFVAVPISTGLAGAGGLGTPIDVQVEGGWNTGLDGDRRIPRETVVTGTVVEVYVRGGDGR